MSTQRRHFAGTEKVAILKKHLIEKVPVSDLCDEFQLYPTQFHAWLKEFVANSPKRFFQITLNQGSSHEIQSEDVVPSSERRIQELANILELIPPMLPNPVADEQLELLHLEFQRYLQQNSDSLYPYTKSVEEFMLVPMA